MATWDREREKREKGVGGEAVRERGKRRGMREGGIENSRLLSKNKPEKTSKPT